MNALYNEIDPFAASWLEQLIAAGHIAPGIVNRNSIADLRPADVAGTGQRHFFAGIGGWSLALRLAGIPDDADIWTGSCPCQPFSSAGKGLGVRDPRHLWPTWFELIRECRPAIVLGEQVASRDGLAWLDLVRSDLERCGYAFGASDLCAASVGAPHVRQRLYFVAIASDERCEGVGLHVRERRSLEGLPETGGAAKLAIELGNSSGSRGRRHTGGVPDAQAQGESKRRRARRERDELEHAGAAGALANGEIERRGSRRMREPYRRPPLEPVRLSASGFWSACDWLPCTDGKARPVEPGTFPLAHGVPARVGRLRGYGNAIVPQVAATFIKAALGAIGEG